MMRDFDFNALSLLQFTGYSIVFLIVAFLLMLIRDFGYVWRIRVLSGNKLSWRKSLNIIVLWEFASAITPSAVGGTSVAIFFVNREGISLGLSSAMVLMTSFLDELYFIVVFPLALILLGSSQLFDFGQATASLFSNQFFWITIIGYSLKLLYTLVVFYGLFINPRGLKWLLLFIFKLPIIRRWRPQAHESGDELLKASNEFKNWSIRNWIKVMIASVLSWTSRYWVVNAIILFLFGYNYLGWGDHFVVFGKQLVMWIMMLIMPTPGGSGFAEVIFKEFLSTDLPAGMESFVAFLWRLITYYPYLIVGAIVVPVWIRKHFIRV
jgi:uncharacterized protein (TIRG00374 family)